MPSTVAGRLRRGRNSHAPSKTGGEQRSATCGYPVPAAMPPPTAKMTKAVSRVSSTTVRKRTIDSAPTSVNALAALLPITCVTMAMRIVSSTSVGMKLGVRLREGAVQR